MTMAPTANDLRHYPRTWAALERIRVALDRLDRMIPRHDPQIAVDLDEMRNGHPSTFPMAGDELLIDEIPCSTYIRLGGEDVIFLGHRGDVLDGMDLDGNSFRYHAAEGETFRFVGDLI